MVKIEQVSAKKGKWVAKKGGNAMKGGSIDKVRKTVGWMNKHGELQSHIHYDEVSPLLSQLDPKTAGQLLNQLDQAKDEVRNPTAWLKKAAARQTGGMYMSGSAFGYDDRKVRKTVGWMNKHSELQSDIHFDEVSPLLSQLDPKTAGQLLNQLDQAKDEVRNPTAWLKKAAARQLSEVYMGGCGFGYDDRKVRKTIGWMNKNSELQSEIHYDQVAPVLSQLDAKSAGQLLHELGEQKAEIKNPTAWLKKAAENAGGKRKIGNRGGLDRRIAKCIGWFNRQGKLQADIRYDEVAPLLAQLDPTDALRIVNELEGKEDEIQDPTNWISVAATSAGAN